MVNSLGVNGVVAGAGAINIDTTAPAITTSSITVSPAPGSQVPLGGVITAAGLNATINVTLTADRPLSAPPQLTELPCLEDGGLSLSCDTPMSLVQGTTQTYVYTHVVSMMDPTSVQFFAVLTDNFGNVSASLPLGTQAIDPLPLNIDSAALGYGGDSPPAPVGNPIRYSANAPYNIVQLTFSSQKDLQAVPASFNVTVGGSRTIPGSNCTRAIAAEYNYTCTYTVDPFEADREGTQLSTLDEEGEDVVIDAIDAAGNAVSYFNPNTTRAVFDLSPPRVSGGLTTISPPAGSTIVPFITAARPGSSVTVSFAASEPLASDPVVTQAALSMSFTEATGVGAPTPPAYQFAGMVPLTGVTDGSYNPTVTMTDLVGNTTPVPVNVGAFQLVTGNHVSAPGIGGVLLTRAPTGCAPCYAGNDPIIPDSPGVPLFTVSGGPNPTTNNNNVGDTIIIYDGPNGVGKNPSVLGITKANANGSFGAQTQFVPNAGEPPFVIAPTSAPSLYLAVADAAGYISPTSEIVAVNWFSTLWNGVSNASTLTEVPNFSATTLAQDPTQSFPPAQSAIPPMYPAVGQAATPLPVVAQPSWTNRVGATSSPGLRYGAAYAFDTKRGVGVLFGGSANGPALLGDTWEWNGDTWTLRSNSGPAARVGASMAFDPLTGTTVLFGGNTGTVQSDTWSWDGNSWSNVTPTSGSPVARQDAAMAYDADVQQIVLFGGRTPAARNDTWMWNGQKWAGVSTANSPTARSLSALAYSATTHSLILVGGFDGTVGAGAFKSDVYTFTGTNWTTITATGAPSGRAGTVVGGMPNGNLALFGGQSGAGPLAEAWNLNVISTTSAAWSQLTVSTPAPTARVQASGSWDSVRGELTIVGGTTGTVTTGGTTGSGTVASDNWGLKISVPNTTAVNETPVAGPSGLYGHSAAFDVSHSVTVVYGGADSSGTAHGETWLWDGHRWSLGAAAGASQTPARSFATMVYDPSAGASCCLADATAAAMRCRTHGFGTAPSGRLRPQAARRLHRARNRRWDTTPFAAWPWCSAGSTVRMQCCWTRGPGHRAAGGSIQPRAPSRPRARWRRRRLMWARAIS